MNSKIEMPKQFLAESKDGKYAISYESDNDRRIWTKSDHSSKIIRFKVNRDSFGTQNISFNGDEIYLEWWAFDKDHNDLHYPDSVLEGKLTIKISDLINEVTEIKL